MQLMNPQVSMGTTPQLCTTITLVFLSAMKVVTKAPSLYEHRISAPCIRYVLPYLVYLCTHE